MFKKVHSKVWAFDCEWIPDPVTGRVVYKLPDSLSDQQVMEEMWKVGGATEEDPMPYLKTVLCRVVSIAAVTRTTSNGQTNLKLLSLPHNPDNTGETRESAILSTFLNAIGNHKPQLIGYNSNSADLKIMIQRGIINGIQTPGFCERPDKPWEGIDYFARGSDYNIDLIEIVGGWGKSSPSLHEIVTASGIPGKISVDGNQVASMWLQGDLDKIVAYNEYDAITTYLLWLRMAHFSGFLNSEVYQEEQDQLKRLLIEESVERPHLKTYLDEWQELQARLEKSKNTL